MAPTQVSEEIRHAAALLKSARRAVALTGAGVSTPSGIPDFRSPGSGLWERYDPMAVASMTAFRYHPEAFYEWVSPLARRILDAKPNAAHLALAQLEGEGRLAGIITQNIDDLHRRAGSAVVLEIHGHLRQATCVSCYRVFPCQDRLESAAVEGKVPHCPVCDGILKPNVILFGEQPPIDVLRKAETLIGASDLILVLGSSLEVTPAALLPVPALNAGARLILINREPTYLDERADVLMHQDVAELLPRLVAEVLRDG